MALRIEFTLLKPIIWLLAAAMVAVGAFGLHYYQSQMDATRTLAMKLGLPEVVAIEEFRLARNSNEMGEVQLAAQVRPTDTRLIMGTGEPPMYLIPLYATDADFLNASPSPFGFFVSSRKPGIEGVRAFGLNEVKVLPDTVQVTAIGTRIDGQSSLEYSPYNFGAADLGLEDGAFLVGNSLVERAARLGNRDVTTGRDVLIFVALSLLAMAGVSHVHGRRQVVIGKPDPKPIPQASSPRSKKAFQPLASQDEIRKTDEVERARRRRSRLSFVTSMTGDPANAVKNPR